MKPRILPRILLAASLLLTARISPAPAADVLVLRGAGATFPYPLYREWFRAYADTRPGIDVSYEPVGSEGGIRQFAAGAVDFGATDAPMTDEEMAALPGPALHIPAAIGAVAVVFNLEGIETLRLSPEVLAGIFLGKISSWNDPRIAALNEAVRLPGSGITVVRRADGSGTTDIFTNYMSTVSLEWRAKIGRGKRVYWPVGLKAEGNEGVAAAVGRTPGSIGYVELAVARRNRMRAASLQNREGHFVAPTLASTSAAAAAAAAAMPADFRASLVDAPGKDSYGICGFTWILVYRDQGDEARGKALASFLGWALKEGQKLNPSLEYAPIPEPLFRKVEAALRTIRFRGNSLF